ncbi:MAG: hypothetical protein AAF146_10430, partial [Bacteroidota bacterium]
EADKVEFLTGNIIFTQYSGAAFLAVAGNGNLEAKTSSDLLDIILSVDGQGSLLDADLLDGQHGSFYQEYSNLNNAPWLTTGFDTYFEGDNVGIGTNNPTEKLQVAGAVRASDLMINGLISTYIGTDSTGKIVAAPAPAASPWSTNANGAYFTGGNVAVGIAVSTGSRLMVFGKYSAISFGQSSTRTHLAVDASGNAYFMRGGIMDDNSVIQGQGAMFSAFVLNNGAAQILTGPFAASGPVSTKVHIEADHDTGVSLLEPTTISNSVAYDSDIVVSLSGTQNDLNPAGIETASCLILENTNVPFNITGIQAQRDGFRLTIINASTIANRTLLLENSGSQASNRIAGNGSYIIAPGMAVDVIRKDYTGRWHVINQ